MFEPFLTKCVDNLRGRFPKESMEVLELASVFSAHRVVDAPNYGVAEIKV